MNTSQLDAMMDLSHARADAYLHIAKGMVMNQFGAATEHFHTEVTVALANMMMQHEAAQIIASAARVPPEPQTPTS